MTKSFFERMGGTYRREGDYLIPNLELPENDAERCSLDQQQQPKVRELLYSSLMVKLEAF